MRNIAIGLVVLLLFMLMSSNAFAQHYTDWTEFEYSAPDDNVHYYEVLRDYTISLPSYFIDADKLPKADDGKLNIMYVWATNLPVLDWDFVKIDQGGILTIKQGFRWDGATLPFWRSPDDYNIRSSMVHDALYTLMRIGYLEADHNHKVWCIDKLSDKTAGDYNRLLADMMIYMIKIEDGQNKTGIPSANNDYRILRKYAACRTHNTDYLESFQPHVSELTAYASDGKVELSWKKANSSGSWPKFNSHFDPYYQLVLKRSDGEEYVLEPARDFDSFVDTNVINGETYSYKIYPGPANKNRTDKSKLEYAFPVVGAGNAMVFDGSNDWIEANTTSNDLKHNYLPFPSSELTIEAWVYPEQKSGRSVIAAFNTMQGNRSNVLYYHNDDQKFCYNDLNVGLCSADEFPVDNWYHVAVSINKINEGVLFVNGEVQATFNSNTRPEWGAKFSIGQEWSHDETARHFKGMIDELRIWSVSRSQAQILADWCHPLLGNDDGLAGLWNFDQPRTMNMIHDATSHANNGILSGVSAIDTAFVMSEAMGVECGPIVIDTTEVLTVAIDIKPGSCPNPLNAKGMKEKRKKKDENGRGHGPSKAVLPVAILGAEDFDVADIDPETITLEGISPVRWSREDVATPVDKSEDSCLCTEETSDGYEDISLKFNRSKIIRAIFAKATVVNQNDSCERKINRNLVSLYLTAKLYDGTEIEGYDCVTLMTKNVRDSSITRAMNETRSRIALQGNYPNPFNPTTTISFTLPEAGQVKVEIFNLLGQRIETLIDGQVNSGYHTVEWDATHIASGIYLYRLQAGDFIDTKKMLLLK